MYEKMLVILKQYFSFSSDNGAQVQSKGGVRRVSAKSPSLTFLMLPLMKSLFVFY